MRFSVTLLVGAFAAIATAQSSNMTTATGVTSSVMAVSSAQAAIDKCLQACAADDVSCRAKCIAVCLRVVYLAAFGLAKATRRQ